MEDTTSGIDRVLLAKLMALARRGAFLRKHADGADLICPGRAAASRPVAGMDLSELGQALGAGWIAHAGAERLALTKRGIALVRAAKSATHGESRMGGDAVNAEAVGRATRPGVNRDESPLAWLRRRCDKHGRPHISAGEFDAGERLRADFWFAQMTPRVTASWSKSAPSRRQRRGAPYAGQDLADNVVAARERVRRALAAVGPELAGVLIDVCCHLRSLGQAEQAAGWPQRAGKVILQLALRRLARHYGIEPAVPASGAPRIRHWGAAGYRPAVDGGEGESERGV
jgi:hypothetical protein